jgi:uncharacterized repeat protein (TIGR03803 family)
VVAALAFSLAASARAATASLGQSGSYTILADFGNSSTDGFAPQGGLMRASDGTLWGTTEVGGNTNVYCIPGCGTVYRLVPNTSGYLRQTIYEFSGPDGAAPFGQLVQAADGTIYGTTSEGGANNTGEIFAILRDTHTFEVAYAFPASAAPPNQTGGAHPASGVVARGSVLFGTTLGNYTSPGPLGTVYAYNELTQSLTTVHWFEGVSSANPAGETSESALLAGSDGRLYGTTAYGGASGYGEVFAMNPDGSNFSILHTFLGADGNSPRAPVVQYDGWIYGVTTGGAGTGGTLFRISPDGSHFQVVYSFAKETSPVSLTPVGGFLFGTTFMGGLSGEGMVFRMSQSGGIRMWHSFRGGNLDGDAPSLDGPLIDLGNGHLVGTTVGGGPYSPPYSNLEYVFGCGTTFFCVTAKVNGGGTVFEIGTSVPSPESPLVRNRTQRNPWQAGHPAPITILNAR